MFTYIFHILEFPGISSFHENFLDNPKFPKISWILGRVETLPKSTQITNPIIWVKSTN